MAAVKANPTDEGGERNRELMEAGEDGHNLH